jgi:hypothetical protein
MPTLTDDALSRRIAPAMQAALDAQRDDILAHANWWQRAVIRGVWPRLIAAIPELADAAIGAIRRSFGHMTLNDVLDWLGNTPHPPIGYRRDGPAN